MNLLMRLLAKYYYFYHDNNVYLIHPIEVRTYRSFPIEFYPTDVDTYVHLRYVNNFEGIRFIITKFPRSKKWLRKSYVRKHKPELLI